MVSGLRFRANDLGFRVTGVRFRVLSFGCRVSGFQISGFGFQGFGFRVSGFGFQISGNGFGFEISERRPGKSTRSGFGRHSSRRFGEMCVRVKGLGFEMEGSEVRGLGLGVRVWGTVLTPECQGVGYSAHT